MKLRPRTFREQQIHAVLCMSSNSDNHLPVCHFQPYFTSERLLYGVVYCIVRAQLACRLVQVVFGECTSARTATLFMTVTGQDGTDGSSRSLVDVFAQVEYPCSCHHPPRTPTVRRIMHISWRIVWRMRWIADLLVCYPVLQLLMDVSVPASVEAIADAIVPIIRIGNGASIF